MHALLRLVNSQEDAKRVLREFASKGITLASVMHDEILTEEIISSDGYVEEHGRHGNKDTLAYGKEFNDKWQPRESNGSVSTQKQFSSLSVHIDGSVGVELSKAISLFVQANGGEVSDIYQANICIFDADSATPTGEMRENCIQVTTTAFLIAFPAAARKLQGHQSDACSTSSEGNSAETVMLDKGSIVDDIKTLLADQDLMTVEKGLGMAQDLPDLIDSLLGGIRIRNGEITLTGLNRELAGSKHRLYSIYNLFSMAPATSKAAKTRASIQYLKVSGHALPLLRGYDNAKEISLLNYSEENGEHANARTPRHCLGIDFTKCTPFPALGKLVCHSAVQSLEGLIAPQLSSLTLRWTDNSPAELKGFLPSSLKRLCVIGLHGRLALDLLSSKDRLERLHIESGEDLDASPLSAFQSLTHVSILAPVERAPSSWPSSLLYLNAGGWLVKSIGKLPSSLLHISVANCRYLRDLQDISDCLTPFEIPYMGRDVTEDEDGLKESGFFSLVGCDSLETLDGIQYCKGLKILALPQQPINISAIKDMEELEALVMPDQEPQPWMVDSFSNITFILPRAKSKYLKGLSGIPRLKLRIDCTVIDTLASFKPVFSNLVSLDLSKVETVRDVSAILSMNQLENLSINGRSGNPAMSILKRSRFSSKRQIDALRMQMLAGIE